MENVARETNELASGDYTYVGINCISGDLLFVFKSIGQRI